MAYNPQNPNGQATKANSSPVVLASDQMSTANVEQTASALPVRPVPQEYFRTTFAKVLASSWDSDYWTLVKLGSGQAISQSAGNGVITTGTTVNSETILRSKTSFNGALTLRAKTILSQRIANNNFFVELVDVIEDGAAITINSATSVTVTFTTNPFTSDNVGQFMYLGGYTGTGTFIPGRYAIASVSGLTVNYTVAGFAAGSGTCSVFGWNYHHIVYTSTTATNALYDAQRNGWNSGDTTATISTTAAPGHMAIINAEDYISLFADQLVATSTTAKQVTERASRVENIPSRDTQLYVQIRTANGTVAPATTTTWTIGVVGVVDYVPQQVSITSVRAQSLNASLPVSVQNTVTVTGTVTANANAGVAAHSAAASGNPVQQGGVVRTTNDTTLVAGDISSIQMTTSMQQVVKEFAPAELDWQNYQAVSTTTAVTVKAAAGAGLRNYVTGFTFSNQNATNDGLVRIQDGTGGATLFQTYVPAKATISVTFPTPLKFTANTLVSVQQQLATGSPTHELNLQGYVGI